MADVEGSTTDLEGRPKGQGYGYVPEAACQMVNSGKLMFLLHDRQINSIAYAKNGSDPITVGTAHASLAALDAATVAAGTYDYYLGSSSVGAYARLGTSPDRMVTFTFEGDVDATDGYVQSAAYLMLRIAKRRGGLVDAEIDTAAFTALHTMNTSRCGLFITEEMTVGQALDMLANSIGAWWGFTAAGLLTCGRLDLPLAGDTPDITLTQDDLVDPDTPIEELVLDGTNGGIPARNVILNYGPIFGVQQPGELVQGASAGTREYFRQQYRRLDSPDAGVATAHLHSEEIEFTSLIIDRANADGAGAAGDYLRRRAAAVPRAGDHQSPDRRRPRRGEHRRQGAAADRPQGPRPRPALRDPRRDPGLGPRRDGAGPVGRGAGHRLHRHLR